MPAYVDPKVRIARFIERAGVKTRKLALELGRQLIAEWPHDGNNAHASELAEAIYTVGLDTAEGAERDVSTQLIAYDESGSALASLPVKFPFHREESQVKGEEKENVISKHAAQLLRHNEGLYQRMLAMSEANASQLQTALNAQQRIVDTLSDRLAKTETLLRESMSREFEALRMVQESMGLLEQAQREQPNAGFNNTIAKVSALVDLAKKAGELKEVQALIDSANLLPKPAAEKPAEQPTPTSTQ